MGHVKNDDTPFYSVLRVMLKCRILLFFAACFFMSSMLKQMQIPFCLFFKSDVKRVETPLFLFSFFFKSCMLKE